MSNIDRRGFLAGMLAAGATSGLPSATLGATAEWATGTHVVLLGTMAGPVFDPSRFMASQILFVEGRGYMIDCGQGAISRMTEMGIPLPSLRNLFVTHHHSDHVADYPALMNLSWIIGIKDKLRVAGPPPMKSMHEAALNFFKEDADIRIKATGRKPMEDSFDVSEITGPGLVFEDEFVRVTSALADHPPGPLALAFRFDTKAGSYVFSGDTTPSDNIVALARGADVLVHEAMYRPAIEQMLAKRQYVPPFLLKFLMSGHSEVADVGRIAERAGVKTLVLSHLLPGDENIPVEIWKAEAAKAFSGRIIVAHDRMII